MGDLITIDAARADEIVALSVPALTEALATLDITSLNLVRLAETAKEAPRTTAVAAIESAIGALLPPEEPEVPEAPTEPVIYDGHTEMRNADGSGCSWRGESYEPDADGVVTVPVAAAADLLDHGFTFVPAKG
jgi:hypothetical protein